MTGGDFFAYIEYEAALLNPFAGTFLQLSKILGNGRIDHNRNAFPTIGAGKENFLSFQKYRKKSPGDFSPGDLKYVLKAYFNACWTVWKL